MAEAVVTLPDGRKARLKGPTREAVEAKARELAGSMQPGRVLESGTLIRQNGNVIGNIAHPQTPTPPPTSAVSAFQRGLLERVGGNVAAIPGILGQGLTGVPNDQSKVPIPSPSGQEVVAGILGGGKAAGNLLKGRDPGLQENFQQSLAQSAQMAEEHPTANALGGAGGDALSILMGRAPFVKAASRAPAAVSKATEMAPGVKRAVTRVLESKAAQKLARGSGRAGQTSLEAAGLAILQDGDPLETGAYAAAGQVVGSVSLEASKGLLSGGFGKAGLKLGAAAFATGSLLQLLKSVTPGGKNFILESLETGYDKVAFALAMGAMSGLAGGGRISGKIADDMPIFMDALSAVPRGVVLSALEDATTDGTAERALNGVLAHPEAFTLQQIEALERGIEERKFAETVNRLMDEDEKFREILSAPDPRLAGVPVRGE